VADHDPRDILVGGVWKQGSGELITVRSPHGGSVLAVVAGAAEADVDEAVRAGQAAMADPSWRELLPHQRARVFTRIADLIEQNLEELARLQTADNGKPITETRALAASAAGTFRYVGATLETLDEELPVARGPYFTMSVHEPLGVIGAITPWNSPLASEAQKIAPALAAGNAVVLKPSAWTPLVALEMGRLIIEAGLPPGLLSVLPGRGSVVGQALVEHPLVAKIAFTGGTATGRRVAHAAADKVMPVSLELGGKSPTVIFDDADIDLAVHGVTYGIFSSQGQACIAGSRLFVHRSRYDEVLEKLVAKAERIVVGDPDDEGTHMGPLINQAHLESVDAYVQLAVQEGGSVRLGGRRLSGGVHDAGAFYPPTIIEGLCASSRVCQEEIFGPVLVVMAFDDDDDLVAQANDSVFGLACGVWTEDYRRAWSVARRIDAGTVWINTYKLLSAAAPFGGFKQSGVGREKGRAWLREYSGQKSIYWGTNARPFQWPDIS